MDGESNRVDGSREISLADLPGYLAEAKVIIIDGRSGSGKTELAGRLAAELGARVVHMDDLYEGWDGLAAGQRYLEQMIIGPLLQGETARWQSWNWAADRREAWQRIGPEEKLIIEGCGSLTPATQQLADRTLWLEAGEPVRRARARSRDGDDWWWEPWAAQEREHLAAHDPLTLADQVVRSG